MGRRYKKVEAGHGHHGGAWKVAYADFVTAMMALFMVMWLLASSDESSRKEISNYFRTGILPDGSLSMKSASQETTPLVEETNTPPPRDKAMVEAEKAAAAKNVAEMLAGLAKDDTELAELMKNVKVTSTPDGILIEMIDKADGLMFESASARLTEPMQRFLREFAPIAAKFKQKIEINGHTDARPFAPGSKLSNWDLSYQRAAAAREILEANGLPPDTVVGVFARGASQLYIPEQPYAPQNRRLTFLIKIPHPPAKPVIVEQPDHIPAAGDTKPVVDDHGKPVVDDHGKPVVDDAKPPAVDGTTAASHSIIEPMSSANPDGVPGGAGRSPAGSIAKPGDVDAKPTTAPAHN